MVTEETTIEFQRSLSILAADRGYSLLWIMSSALGVLVAWFCWALCARVALYEVTPEARVELDGATYPIDAPFVGRIVSSDLRVGRDVQRGELLTEIDAMPQRLQLDQLTVETQGIAPQMLRLQAQVEAEERSRTEAVQTAHLGGREAQSRVAEAQIPATFAEQDLVRVRKLYEDHLVSARELQRAESDAGRLRVAVGTLQVEVNRVAQEQAARNRECDVRIARLRGEMATLESQRASLQAEATRLEYEIERRRIRAPVDGRIAEAANVRIGAVVAEGDRLGSIVPAGRLLVVAQYPASAALGRIRSGQRATLRLDGYPWAEFGTVAATVSTVAQEVRAGKVRVELALERNASFRGVLEHGMPGTLEIAVERVSPWTLILRTSGQWLSQPT